MAGKRKTLLSSKRAIAAKKKRENKTQENKTQEQISFRLEKVRNKTGITRENETPEQRSFRLDNLRAHTAKTRENEFLQEGSSIIALASTSRFQRALQLVFSYHH